MKPIVLALTLALVAGCAALQDRGQQSAAGASSSGLTNDNHPWPVCRETSLCTRP